MNNSNKGFNRIIEEDKIRFGIIFLDEIKKDEIKKEEYVERNKPSDEIVKKLKYYLDKSRLKNAKEDLDK